MLSDQPDYTRTQVFPGSVYSGLLYINLAGREPTGVVPIKKRKELASEIAAKLRQIEEPETGYPLFSYVYTSEELYTGPLLEHAPDLIIDSYDTEWGIQVSKYVPTLERKINRYFLQDAKHQDFGWHSRDGIFVFSGHDFGVGQASCEGHVMDLPATLLHLYGIPIPEDYDGQVLTELMTSKLGQQPLRYQSGDAVTMTPLDHSYSAAEEELVASHLRALGYLG